MDIDDLLRTIEAEAEADAQPMSLTEVARHEAVAASMRLGFAKPRFRPRVALRFSGPGVIGHDLPGPTASSVIASFDALVETAATELHLPPGSADMFLSPEVVPGSTVLHLFGREPSGDDTLDADIDDTPADQAIGMALDALGSLISRRSETVDGRLGAKLYRLADVVIQGQVDLALRWTRPRGAAVDQGLTREDAAHIRSVLDSSQRVTSLIENQAGIVEAIDAAKNTVGLRVGKALFTLEATSIDSELLRQAWGRRVVADWLEVTTSFAQRDKEVIQRALTSLRIAPDPIEG